MEQQSQNRQEMREVTKREMQKIAGVPLLLLVDQIPRSFLEALADRR